MVTVTDVKETYSRSVIPLVNGFNSLLTKFIPGKEELVVIVIALFIGWKFRDRQYLTGGYGYWLKVSAIVYIIFKIVGLGFNPLSLIR